MRIEFMQIPPRFFILMFLAFAGFVSCEKEYSNELGATPTPSSGDLLISAVLKNEFSEARITYQYNPLNQIMNNLIKFTSIFESGDYSVEALRDANGKITKSRIVIITILNPNGDSIYYQLSRNSAGKVAYALIKDSETATPPTYDSIVYLYNAGRLSGAINYFIDKTSAIVEPVQKIEFTYTGPNVTKSVEYELAGSLSVQKLVETINLEYDSNPAAMALGEDEYIVGLIPANLLFPAINNVKKYELKNEDDPTLNSITTYTYTYGTNGKPSAASIVTSVVGIPDSKESMTFTYR